MNKQIFIILAVSILFSSNQDNESFDEIDNISFLEVDLGYNVATGLFEKYTDNGISVRVNYSQKIANSDFFRWQKLRKSE